MNATPALDVLWRKALLVLALVAVHFLAACGPMKCQSNAAHATTGAQLGDPCHVSSDCVAAGTACTTTWADVAGTPSMTCTLACDPQHACPAGFACAPNGGLENMDAGAGVGVCVRSCSSNADCQTGQAAGFCTSADGGPQLCKPIGRCSGAEPSPCPGGYVCVDALAPGTGCIDESWCQQH